MTTPFDASNPESASDGAASEADARFVNALLERALGRAAHEEDARRLRLAMTAIDRGGRSGSRHSWIWGVAGTVVAAGLLLCVILISGSSPTARAATPLEWVQRVLSVSRDDERPLRYRVTIDHPRAMMLQGGGLEGGELIRGGSRGFTLSMQRPFGSMMIGSNGSEWWMVPSFDMMPVMVSDVPPGELHRAKERGEEADASDEQSGSFSGHRFPGGLGGPLGMNDLSGLLGTAEFLDVPEILAAMAKTHDLEFLDEPEGSDHFRVLGKLRPPESNRHPRRIELVADSRSGTLRTLILSWDTEDHHFVPRSLEFQLTGPADVTSDWFQHAAHHDPSRRVHKLEAR